jgi:hypothetical protein
MKKIIPSAFGSSGVYNTVGSPLIGGDATWKRLLLKNNAKQGKRN